MRRCDLGDQFFGKLYGFDAGSLPATGDFTIAGSSNRDKLGSGLVVTGGTRFRIRYTDKAEVHPMAALANAAEDLAQIVAKERNRGFWSRVFGKRPC